MPKPTNKKMSELVINAIDDTFDAIELGLDYEQCEDFIRERRTDPTKHTFQQFIIPKEVHWKELQEHYHNSCIVVRKFCIKMSSTT